MAGYQHDSVTLSFDLNEAWVFTTLKSLVNFDVKLIVRVTDANYFFNFFLICSIILHCELDKNVRIGPSPVLNWIQFLVIIIVR